MLFRSQYKIRLNDNLPAGTHVNNTAYIYFDFNAPVLTNTTTNTISTNTGIQTLKTQHSTFSMYPNPASNSVTITVDESLLNTTATITDITGRKMMSVQLNTQHSTLSTSNFANGVYILSISKQCGVLTQKLVVQR